MSAQNAYIQYSLDDYFQSTPIGSIDRAIGNSLYGMNHQQIPAMVSSNWDLYGFTFFTRPQLNLQSDNVRNIRQFYPLLTGNPASMQRFVRTTLDPRLIIGYNVPINVGGSTYSVPPISCPVTDNTMAFMSVLTNNLNSISGWPDITAPTFTSKSGLYNQAFSHVDGTSRSYETFDIDATFRNTRGDTILYLFYVWLWYQSMVFEGYMVPYLDFIAENEIDYNTRIYRLVLDQTRTYVKKIAATIAFPISVPMSAFFDFNKEKPYNDQNADFTIRFRCNGVNYMDDIIVYEFNKAVGIFNPNMTDQYRTNTMVKIDKSLLNIFNNRGYPYIDENTYELQWWVDQDLFTNRVSAFLQTGALPSNTSYSQTNGAVTSGGAPFTDYNPGTT